MLKNKAKNQILNLISQKPGLSAKEILANLPLTRAMVFRHLKKMIELDQIFKIGTTPKVKYYPKLPVEKNSETEKFFFEWSLTGQSRQAPAEWLCPTRDIFQARQEKLLLVLKNLVNENLLYLIVSAVGEIGNNSFDHNLGNWRDTAGVLFFVDLEAREIFLADRGQGVLATIKRVRPSIANHGQALQVAFTEIISGRAPEQRGNGLKFVKKIIEENNLSLQFFSGSAKAEITKARFLVSQSNKNIPGCLAIIKF